MAVAEPQAPSLRASASALRDTTRWIITAAAALASLLIAGLRFADIGRLSPAHGWYWLGIAGSGLALVSVGAIVWRASGVLTLRYRTFSEVLIDLERAEGVGVTAGTPRSLANAMLLENDYLLAGIASNMNNLWDQARSVNRRFVTGRPAVRDEQRKVQLDKAIERVMDFVDNWETERRFRTLLRTLVWSGVAAFIGMTVLATAVGYAPNVPPLVNSPIQADVTFTTRGLGYENRLIGCALNVRHGVVIAGDSATQILSFPAVSGCKAAVMKVSPNIAIVVPDNRP
jgi:hypothetical protein